MVVNAGSPFRMRDVSFAYPGREAAAVRDVGFEAGAGDGIAVLGANGAGKSTLLRLAMALVHPTSGTVEVGGRDTRGLAPEDVARDAGFLFQHPELQLLERSVTAEVAYGLRQRGTAGSEAEARARVVLAETGLDAVADEHPYDLSPSLRRLVALAAALATEPAVLLLDEPTAGLDRAARAVVAAVVRARRERGAAVLAVTHDGEFALEALSDAFVMDQGRIVARGAVEAVLGTRPSVPDLPASAALARRLQLATTSPRAAPVAVALAERCRLLG